jgi:hypothetical protein
LPRWRCWCGDVWICFCFGVMSSSALAITRELWLIYQRENCFDLSADTSSGRQKQICSDTDLLLILFVCSVHESELLKGLLYFSTCSVQPHLFV